MRAVQLGAVFSRLSLGTRYARRAAEGGTSRFTPLNFRPTARPDECLGAASMNSPIWLAGQPYEKPAEGKAAHLHPWVSGFEFS